MTQALFHMWGPFRKQLITGHGFYMEQARKRLLSQFENMDEEADKYAEEWLANCSHLFDPYRHDPDVFHEQAYDESIEFYRMLEEMRNNTRLSVVAGLFHEWDKQLRDWTEREIHHWHYGEEVNNALWAASFKDIIDLFEGLGWSIRSKGYYLSLYQCRLVVNIYKHGNGDSFKELKAAHPEFIDGSTRNFPIFLDHADYTSLKIEDEHITLFFNAITEFWKDVPEYIWNKETFDLPKWFEKAYGKDIKKLEAAKS